jgi:hypothetical protein
VVVEVTAVVPVTPAGGVIVSVYPETQFVVTVALQGTLDIGALQVAVRVL